MDIHKTIVTKSSVETENLGFAHANRIIRLWEGGENTRCHIICLYGNLGAGKTTFSQGFARGIGITGRLLSPTFILVKRYSLTYPERYFFHIDLYRTQTADDIREIGLSEIVSDPRSCVLIEWAEKLGGYLPDVRTDIRFSIEPDGSHRLEQSDITG